MKSSLKIKHFGTKFVINFLIILTKMKKFCSSKKFVRLIALLILLYQIISVTISYSEFETVIDMKAISDLENKPTFTFCLKNDFEFPKESENFYFAKILKLSGTIGCALKSGTIYNTVLNCSKFTKIVESVTPFSQRCLSYLSQLLDNKSKNVAFLFDDKINLFGLIHQKRTPPHFSRLKIEYSNSSFHYIDYIRTVTKLLPFPYSTDCYNYTNEEKSVINYKSREYCIVKHLEKNKFIECGCNKRWFYGYSDSENFSIICKKIY
jgi:hypothetical protein